MSNLINLPAPITVSVGIRKPFTQVDVAWVARNYVMRTDSVADETTVTPSMLPTSPALAKTGMGTAPNPQSFVQGLVYLACRHAHGNSVDITGMPSFSVHALDAACRTLPKGKGCNARMLINAAEFGIAALLALPAPAARKKPGETMPTVSPAPAVVDAAPTTTDAAPVVDIYVDGPIGADADSAIAEVAANAAQDARIASEAKALADAAQAAEYRAAQAAKFAADAQMADDAIVATICGRADAEAILRELASQLGFTLRKVPAKKAA